MSKVTFLENDVVVEEASNVEVPGPEFRHSGKLNAITIAVDDLSDTAITWVAVSTRDVDITVSLLYAGPTTQSYVVKKGNPLLVNSEGGAVAFSNSVTIGAADGVSQANCEIHIYTGDQELKPEDPAFLILNAGTGITEEEFTPGDVASWTDTRASTSAPLPFRWIGGPSPKIIASDSDFGGKPSVSFDTFNIVAAYFEYTTSTSTIFNFMRAKGTSADDFTVMAILFVPDVADPTHPATGIWNTSTSTSFEGFRAGVDGGYRPLIEAAGSASNITTKLGAEELVSKPMVMVWRYNGSSGGMRIYRQGVWEQEVSMTVVNASLDSSPFRIGSNLYTAGGGIPTNMQGKIADIRVYDQLLSVDDIDEYIATAVSDYGIDDTPEQGFPFLSSAFGYHRADKGLTPTGATTWLDMRHEAYAASDGKTWTHSDGTNINAAQQNGILGGAHALAFDGDPEGLQNAMNANADHLAGSAFTIGMVYYYTGPTSERGLFTMADANTDDGIANLNIEYPANSIGLLRYEITNAADQDVILTDAPLISSPSIARAIVFRGDGDNCYIDEINLLSPTVVFSKQVAYAFTEGTTTADGVHLMTYPAENSLDFLSGAVGEVWHQATSISDADVLTYFKYLANRYNNP